MDIEGGLIVITDTVTAHIALIRQDQRRRKRVYRDTGSLIVISDRRDDHADLLRRESHLI